MSFVDLATLTLHRRNELEARINVFLGKCDHAITDIHKLKAQAQGFVEQLNCEPSELKERFLNCMKQLDEFTYLVTDFNLAIGKLEETNASEHIPVQGDTIKPPISTQHVKHVNLLDVLSEASPSTSSSCPNQCPSEKPKRLKVPKEDQLIAFSSSSSSESVPQSKSVTAANEVQCEQAEGVHNATITCQSPGSPEACNLPAQQILPLDKVYPAIIMSVDQDSFWVSISDKIDEAYRLMIDMTEYYKNNHVEMTLQEVESLNYCAYYDESTDCSYRALFIKVLEEDMMSVEVFLVDTGEVRTALVSDVQPLMPQFCSSPPSARCCHLAGVDLLCYQNQDLMQKHEEFMKEYVGAQTRIVVDDNTSESLGVNVFLLPSNESLNELIVQKGLATANKPQPEPPQMKVGPPELVNSSDFDITQCPEYEDPVEAVTGYSNRDEADICKHYKGGPKKTCFKGARCTKKHILKHPDGWTTDKVEVVAKLKSFPLPKPNTSHCVLVTYVCHFDRLYVQFVEEEPKDIDQKPPSFGVVLPPTSLADLVRDMNSPAARMAYTPLTLSPAPGEMVAALYPLDKNWYRARVLTVSRADQNVEIMYVDYGNVVWVKENEICTLDARYLSLPMQAVRCVLAGVTARTNNSAQWACAKQELANMTLNRRLIAHVIARDYDELIIQLFDDGFNVAEQLTSHGTIELKNYAVHDDTHLNRRIVAA